MIPVYFEDEGLEKYVMDGDSLIAVPFQISEDVRGERKITAYRSFGDFAEDFARRFEQDPLSREAKEYVEKTLAPKMKSAGYEYESEYDQTVVSYEAVKDKLAPVSRSVCVELIDNNERLSQLYFATTRDVEIDDGDPADCVAAAVRDSVVLSAASVNDYSDDGSVEINVETAINERCKGYAVACVSALAAYLLSLGERVSYKCRETNVASRRVAEKCGLVYTGKTYNFVCYSK